jgi:hypothetical protein
MAISVFPAPVAGGSSSSAFAMTLSSLGTCFEADVALDTGIYTASVSPTTTNAQIVIASDSSIISTQTTTSGTVAFNLATPATKVFITGAVTGTVGAVVTITKTADSLSPDDIGNGTLDTINTSGQYNQTGLLGVLVYGGGAGGYLGNIGNYNATGGGGGRAGFINGGMVFTNGPTAVSVGAAGIAANINVAAQAPGNSSFGNLVVANSASNIFTNGNGAPGQRYGSANGNASGVFSSWNGNATTGGGGGGNNNSSGSGNLGAGSGIGTGGNTGGGGGNAATGKASGGGGGMASVWGQNTAPKLEGGDGAPGVVYVMRGF